VCAQVVSAGVFESQVIDEVCAALAEHLVRLVATVDTLRGATFVINVESNLAYFAESVETYLRQRARLLPRFHVLRNDLRRTHSAAAAAGGGATDVDAVYTAGTRTTQRNKKQMVLAFDALLRGGFVRFARELFAHPGGADAAKRYRAEIVKELGAFKRELVFPKPRGQRVPTARETYSGKYGRNRDDWVMAVLIASFTFDVIYRSDRMRGLFGMPGL
jgi:hypothetical protein